MTKRQIIDEIIVSNPSAAAEFLAQFDQDDLLQYLRHLEAVRAPRLTGDASRYLHYFPTPQVDHVDDLSVLVPAQHAAAAACPAAVISPVDADLIDQDQFDADLLDLVGELAGATPADPRAETIEFEPIMVGDSAEPDSAESPAPQPAPAVQAAEPAPQITYEGEGDMVSVRAQQEEGFDDQQESWLF